ncbi:unnamed protein product [Lasius platythorax]|uniref:Uncharacterized protein n=1 Tax=Lasius platythorax TaxID=488582 RepID=A0AAV2NZF6_9HYME
MQNVNFACVESEDETRRRRESLLQSEDVSRSSRCKDVVSVGSYKSVPLSASVTRKRRACASLLPLLERVSGTSSLPNRCSIDYQASVAVAASPASHLSSNCRGEFLKTSDPRFTQLVIIWNISRHIIPFDIA